MATNYKKLMKENNPEKYAQYLAYQRLAAAERRRKKKEKWENEPVTRAMELEREREIILHRERNKRYREKLQQKADSTNRSTRQSSTKPVATSATATPQVRPKDMTAEEYRLHKNKLRAESRARRSAQKKRWDRQKARERYRRNAAAVTPTALPPASSITAPLMSSPQAFAPSCHPPQPSTSTPKRLPKRLYNINNLTSRAKQAISKRLRGDSDQYAKIIKNLATPRTPEKRKAIRLLGVFKSPSKKRKLPKNRGPAIQRRRPRKIRSPKEKADQMVKVFYTRRDVSRQLPHKRYATKHGAGYVMTTTLRGAWRQFTAENPSIGISYTKFCGLRPKIVRKLCTVAVETCLCMYCLNVRYKLQALNRVLAKAGKDQLPTEGKMLDFVCCDKKDARWYEPSCIERTCRKCQDSLKQFKGACRDILEEQVSWKYWGRGQLSLKLDVFAKKGTVSDLLEHLLMDLDRPTKSSNFRSHLFTACWQYH